MNEFIRLMALMLSIAEYSIESSFLRRWPSAPLPVPLDYQSWLV
jgi:hypothetical protein